jgi:hypothetical protein
VSYVAYYFHWSLGEILDLEHPLRRAFVDQIEAIDAGRAAMVEAIDPRTGE